MIVDDARALVLTVRFHDGRYHGEPEWPPSPARLFQALVAGCVRAGRLNDADRLALEWLEALEPPWIAAPITCAGQPIKLWVPNNDLDAKGGDPDAIAMIRTSKQVRPRLFDREIPFAYGWTVADPKDEAKAIRVCEMTRELYQLGRGIDMASASGQLLDLGALARLLNTHCGSIHRPSPGRAARDPGLLSPTGGSLVSLEARYTATLARFQTVGEGRNARDLFQQPPKPTFGQVPYDLAVARELFEIRPAGKLGAFCATALDRVAWLTELLRDAAAARLAAALPHLGEDIERALIGRAVEGQAPLQPEQRVRIVPLPSIGHPQADRAVRRFMVDVPSANPLRAGDVFWAFSGLEFRTPSNAEAVVTRTDDRRMLEHYGAGGAPFVRWRTVTAAALPIARRRIDPTRRSEEAKSASERASEEARAGRAVLQALRHAGVRTAVERVQVQREPFVAKGARAEAFGPGTRFRKERLWHVDLTFCDPVGGPLVIGDGRFLGLGIMECVEEYPHAWAFRVREGLAKNAPPVGIAEAVRRAVMARFQRQIGETESLPAYVSGHDAKGNPAADTARLSFAYDPESERLLVIPPHTLRHRRPRENERRHLRTLASALAGFTELRAGTAGLLVLQPVPLDTDNDPLFACGHHWVSRTPYTVNRHLARDDAHAALTADLEAAVRGAGMPRAKINVRHAWSVRGIGLMGLAELEFDVAVHGPVVLGRTRFKGGGLFAASDEALSR